MAKRILFYKLLQRIKVVVCIFILFTCIHIKAQAFSPGEKRVTISFKNEVLKKVFKSIQVQTGLILTYSNDQIDENSIVSVNARDLPVNELLIKLFGGSDIIWTYQGNYVVIKKGISAKKNDDFPVDSLITISGVLKSEDGQPIPGATIMVKGARMGTKTDETGRFSLPFISRKAVIVITSLGFSSVEMSASVIVNNQNIVLKTFVELMDEKIVTAYSTTTLRLNVGGGIGVVRAKDIEKMPVTNPLLALQGTVPGVVVTQIGGLANSAVSVQIRGQISMLNGNDPFYVIDGVPYISKSMPSNTGVLGYNVSGQYSSPLSFINPSDIESISVLKDADATSIYGSRAAAGAILITTKRGKEGPTRINVNVQNGWANVNRKVNLMDTKQYMAMRHEGKINSGEEIFDTDYDLNGVWDTTRSTDWQKVLIGGTAKYADYQLSASGGNANTQFLIGAGYHNETTVFPGDYKNKKGSVHFNINNNSANQKFHILLSGNYQADNNNIPSADFTDIALTLSSIAPALYNKDGSLNWESYNGVSTWDNPLAILKNKSQIKTNNLISNLKLSYDISPSLTIKVNGGYTNLQTNEIQLFPLTSIAPEIRKYVQRRSTFNSTNSNSWVVEPQLNYNTQFGKSKIEAIIGSSIQQNNSKASSYTATGFTSDLVMEDVRSATTVRSSRNLAAVYKYNALFGNLNYNWDAKYIINLSARRDGSSRFGSENQFHDFWSVAGAWVFTNEPILRKASSALTFGKIRASYGTTGNDQIGDYSFLNLYSPYSVTVPYQGTVGLTVNSLPNPRLQWEETNKLQLGMDIGLLKNQRILINLDYYRNRSSNQLLNYALSGITGFTNILRNFPATVQNSGIEFTVNSKNILTRDFTWTTSLNISIPKNKLVAFPNLALSSYASSYIVGQPINISRVFHYLGVNPQTGLYEFADSHGSATSEPSDITDMTVLINTLPKYYGGLQNSFNYKGIQLDILFQFTNQISQGAFQGNLFPGRFNYNQPVSLLEGRWKNVGDNDKIIQKFTSNVADGVRTSLDAAGRSDKAFINGSFVRLKNVSLSWQVSQKLLDKVKVQSCRLYLHAQNLLTFTKYDLLDPETRSSYILPPLRVITAGIQLGL